MPGSGVNVLDDLGLDLNDEPRQLVLANGVRLTFRPPEGPDWQVARRRAEQAFAARDDFATAMARYGWSSPEALQLLDAERWSEAGVFCVAVELAAVVVTEVGRMVGADWRTVAPSIAVFRVLFKQNDALDRFWSAAKEADRELIQPKKEPPPSLPGSGARAASTAGDAKGPAPAPSRPSARRTARND